MQSYINIKSIHLALTKTSPLVGFKSKAYDWLVLNSKQEGLRLVGFKYQKAGDWVDSKFHCSYLESRGVPEKTRQKSGEKRRLKLSLFDLSFRFTSGSGDVTSGDVASVTSGDATSGDVISGDVTISIYPPQI